MNHPQFVRFTEKVAVLPLPSFAVAVIIGPPLGSPLVSSIVISPVALIDKYPVV